MTPKEKSLKVPKDLGLKVVSKEKAFWLRCKENGEEQIKMAEEDLLLKKAVMETINNKLKSF